MKKSQELMEQAKKLMAEAEKLRQQEVKEAIAEIRALMKKYNLSARDIVDPNERLARRSDSPAPPKYRGPNGELWAGGRGRRPGWVKKALAEGRNLEEFRIP